MHCWDQSTLFTKPQKVSGGHQVAFAAVLTYRWLPEHPFTPKHQTAELRARVLAPCGISVGAWADVRALRTVSPVPAL